MSLDNLLDLPIGRGRMPTIVGLVVVTLILGSAALGVRIETSNESMNAIDPETAAFHQSFTETFGSDELVLLSVSHPALLTGAGLQRVDRLTERIARFDGVSRVKSLTNLRQVVSDAGGATDAPLISRPLTSADTTSNAERSLARNPQWTGLLISEDRRTAGIAIELELRPDDSNHPGRLIDELRGLIAEPENQRAELHLTGIAVQKHDATLFVVRDTRFLLPLSALVLATLLALIFRRKSGVVLPMLVTVTTLLWTLGLYAYLDYELNIITSLLPPVIMVLAITTSIHLYNCWIVMARTMEPGPELVHRVMRSLFAPCALTALTTIIGLLSLAVSDVPAVRQFGLFAAAGIGISLVLNYTIMPIGLSLLTPRPKRKAGIDDPAERVLSGIAAFSVRRPVTILVVAAVVTLLGAAGLLRIRNNTDLVRFLKPSTELFRDTMFIDSNLTGANALELVLERRDGAPLTGVDDVRRLAKLQVRLAELESVSKVLSVADLIRQLHRAEVGGDELILPDDPEELLYCFDLIEAADRPDELRGLITSDFRSARLAVRLRVIGTAKAERLLATIRALAAEVLGADYTLRPTGSFYHVVMDSNRLVASQVRSFSLALGLVLVVMAAAFRSFKLLVAALMPNLMPIVWTAGLMGWAGIDLSIATAMIASVAIGIAVHDTIHYIAHYKWMLPQGRVEAIRATTCGTGRALVITSVVLTLGFWVGAFSSFKPTIYFSLLTGVTILGALVCDLLVLPACLQLMRSEASAPQAATGPRTTGP